MDRYVMLIQLNSSDGIISGISDLLANLNSSTPASSEEWKSFTDNIYTTSHSLTQLSEKWEKVTLSTCDDGASEELQERHTIDELAESIQNAANLLPPYGAVVEVYWSINDDNLPEIESEFGLYGALLCLLEWHHATFTFVTADGIELKANTSDWVQSLRARVTSKTELAQNTQQTLWSGNVSITNGPNKGKLSLPGFCLRTFPTVPPSTHGVTLSFKSSAKIVRESDVLVDHEMELLAHMMTADIPVFYISTTKFTLNVHHQSRDSSHEFLDELVENKQMCYLLRLKRGIGYETNKHTTGAKSWMSQIAENVENIKKDASGGATLQDPGFYHILLQACSTIDNLFIAHILHPLSNINGAIMHDLAVIQPRLGIPSADEKKVTDFINDLSFFTGSQVTDLQRDIEITQAQMIHKWIKHKQQNDNDASITQAELQQLLYITQTECLQHLQGQKLSTESITQYEITEPVPEYSRSTRPLEYIVMQIRDEREKKLRKSRSSDHLGGLSPPVKSATISLEAKDLLEYFTADGRPISQDFHVLQNKGKLQKFDSGDNLSVEWPDALHHNNHGFYYYKGAFTDKRERLYDRLRSCMQSSETITTCSSTQRHKTPKVSFRSSFKEKSPQMALATQSTGRSRTLPERGRTLPERGRTLSERGRTLSDKEMRFLSRKRKHDRMVSPSRSRDRALQANRKLLNQRQSGDKSDSKATNQKTEQKETRSQRHARKLEDIVKYTLKVKGVRQRDNIYSGCVKRLFQLTKCFVKDLTTSRNLAQEMENIAMSQVDQVIEFEKKFLAK